MRHETPPPQALPRARRQLAVRRQRRPCYEAVIMAPGDIVDTPVPRQYVEAAPSTQAFHRYRDQLDVGVKDDDHAVIEMIMMPALLTSCGDLKIIAAAARAR